MSLKKSLCVAVVLFITPSVGFAEESSVKLDKLVDRCASLVDVYGSMTAVRKKQNMAKSFLYSSVSSVDPYLPLSDEYGLAGKFVRFRMEMSTKINDIVSDDFTASTKNLSKLIKDMCF